MYAEQRTRYVRHTCFSLFSGCLAVSVGRNGLAVPLVEELLRPQEAGHEEVE
jgi:hypothetical protein